MIEVLQVAVDGTDEAWERVTGEPDVRGVEAGRIDFAGGWNVTVAVMEFVREDPLESELRRRIAAALRSVGGVETAGEMDREVWFVTGTPSAMRWSGLRQKSWTTSPARHARMPEAEGGANPLPCGRVSVPGIPADLGAGLTNSDFVAAEMRSHLTSGRFSQAKPGLGASGCLTVAGVVNPENHHSRPVR